MISFRTMTNYDVDAGISLCRAAGWNQLDRDWQIMLQLSTDGCRVAIRDGKVIGTVTTIRYQKSFSWIGMVLVDPSHRGQGTGTSLLREALSILQIEETIKLDATPAGREIYLKLNFVDEYNITRMSTGASLKNVKGSAAQLLQRKDIKAITSCDNKIFGADRQPLLEWMWGQAPRYAFIIKGKNEIYGYCLGRHGYNFTHIGPVIAENLDVAKELVSAALLNCASQPVIIDAMKFDSAWLEWLSSIGFKEQRPLMRMYCGENKFPGIPEKQFAILGPEFG